MFSAPLKCLVGNDPPNFGIPIFRLSTVCGGDAASTVQTTRGLVLLTLQRRGAGVAAAWLSAPSLPRQRLRPADRAADATCARLSHASIRAALRPGAHTPVALGRPVSRRAVASVHTAMR
eukprot:352352-Chlamydomonas_euryale.AAC.1